MRVAQINTTYGDGDSTGRTTKEMNEWLQKNNFVSRAFCASINDGKTYDENVIVFSDKINQMTHAVFSRITGLQGYFSLIHTRLLISKLKEFQCDVVILRVLHSNCVDLGMLIKYLGKNDISTIVMLHDCWYYTGHCTNYTYHSCDKWKHECNHCKYMNNDNSSLFFDTSRKCFNDKKKWFGSISSLTVVGVSEWIASEAKYSFFRRQKIYSIYNWIDLDTFHEVNNKEDVYAQYREKYKYILLGVASRWSEEKGIRTIQYMANKAKNCVFVLIGGEPSNMEIDSDNIKFVGKITNKEELASYYSQADVFVNPSKQETFGKTTAEAFSCGTPVVAFNVSASAELVQSSRGYRAKLNDEDFMQGVIKVLNNGRNYYRKNCREFAVANFSIDTNMRKYINLMSNMVESKK